VGCVAERVGGVQQQRELRCAEGLLHGGARGGGRGLPALKVRDCSGGELMQWREVTIYTHPVYRFRSLWGEATFRRLTPRMYKVEFRGGRGLPFAKGLANFSPEEKGVHFPSGSSAGGQEGAQGG
jgi:hypothetical protein